MLLYFESGLDAKKLKPISEVTSWFYMFSKSIIHCCFCFVECLNAPFIFKIASHRLAFSYLRGMLVLVIVFWGIEHVSFSLHQILWACETTCQSCRRCSASYLFPLEYFFWWKHFMLWFFKGGRKPRMKWLRWSRSSRMQASRQRNHCVRR